MSNGVPLIDIQAWFGRDEAARDAVARDVAAACEKWGFLILAGHQIDPALMKAVADVSRPFFDLPVSDKLELDAIGSNGGRGYYRMEAKSLARTLGDKNAPGDLRESFRIGAEARDDDPMTTAPAAAGHFAPNIWPRVPADFRKIYESYYEACDALSAELMRICARSLGLADDWFDDKINRATSNLIAQHYPPLEKPPVAGQVRNGAHTDFGTLTLLMAEDRPGGLQVMGMDGEWQDIRPIPGAFIVNLGDMMAQWTNDKWRSTLHRVVNPPIDAGAASRRLSVVFFHTPNYDATIACIPSCADAEHPPKYAPVLSGEHIARKLKAVESTAKESTNPPHKIAIR
jgi:isopenicillin N synthase-like dioxygenase